MNPDYGCTPFQCIRPTVRPNPIEIISRAFLVGLGLQPDEIEAIQGLRELAPPGNLGADLPEPVRSPPQQGDPHSTGTT